MSQDDAVQDLQKRLKQAIVLNRTAAMLCEEKDPVELFDTIISLLPDALRFPDLASVRLTFAENDRSSPGFHPTPWGESETFRVAGGKMGTLEVYYLNAPPNGGESPILTRDEVAMLHSVTKMLRTYFDRNEKQRSAQEEQQHAASYTRSLIEASLDPLVTISPDGKVTDVNKATEEITGIPRAKLIGTDFSSYFTEPDKAKRGYEKVLSDGAVRDYALTIRHASGRTSDVLYNASLYRDSENRVQGVFAAARDITEKKAAEEALRKVSLRNEMILSSVGEGIYGTDAVGTILFANPILEKMFGFRIDELIGKNSHRLLHYARPDGTPFPFDECPLHKTMKEQSATRQDDVFWAKDGQAIPVEYISTPLLEKGRFVGAVNVIRDISERKRIEGELRSASEYARSLIEASLDPLVTISSDGKIMDVNQATEQVTGIGRDHLIGTDFASYFTDPEKARAGYRQVLKAGFVRDYPLTLRHCSGRVLDVLYNATVYKDSEGKPQGVFAAARDVTQLKRIDAEIRRTRDRLQEAQRFAHIGNWDWDIKTNELWWSDEIYRIFGLEPQEFGVTYEGFLTRVHPEDARRVDQAVNESLAGKKPYAVDHRIVLPDGEIRIVHERAEVTRDPGGQAIRMIGTAQDVTEIRKAEEELGRHREHLEELVTQRTTELQRANERLAKLNQDLESFTYSVSHDLRAPLRAIEGFSAILLEDYQPKLDQEGKRVLNVIVENTRKMRDLIGDILMFSRASRMSVEKNDVNMHDLAMGVIDELKPLSDRRKIDFDVLPLGSAWVDRAAIRQVLVNLIANSIKFTRTRAVAKIEVGSRDEDEQRVFYVKDNGVGFDMRYSGKLFQVFQRLHRAEEFEGTGAGLAIVKQIVEKHGGRVWAEAKPDAGATFYFSLPQAKGQKESVEAA